MESFYQHVKHVNIVAETEPWGKFSWGNLFGGICIGEFLWENCDRIGFGTHLVPWYAFDCIG